MGDRVYSFDVFDTVLTRNLVSPKDLFRLMQEYLPEALPMIPLKLGKSFSGGRVLAEFWARRLSSREDILLRDIYAVLGSWYELSDEHQSALMDFEMTMEQKVLVPVGGVIALLRQKRQLGTVLFISDMYLPESFIRKVLVDLGVAEQEDSVYVSGEYGLTKGSGHLFQKVLSDYEISADRLVHFGDNPVSDFFVPLTLGIQFDSSIGEPAMNNSRFAKLRLRGNYLMELCWAGFQMARNFYA